MRFTWDEKKRRSNVHKHGLDFVDAAEIFDGPMLTRLDARANEDGEDRWIGIGVTKNSAVVVVYVEHEKSETIRILSLRRALKHERENYERTLND